MAGTAKRQIVFINTAHFFTHYCLLILATAVLGMVAQAPARFGAEYGPILALGTAMFVLYGLGSLPMGWLAERFGRKPMMAAFFLASSQCFWTLPLPSSGESAQAMAGKLNAIGV